MYVNINELIDLTTYRISFTILNHYLYTHLRHIFHFIFGKYALNTYAKLVRKYQLYLIDVRYVKDCVYNYSFIKQLSFLMLTKYKNYVYFL